jgi:ATP-dependent Clp protease ATP-binding subunit ClpB
VSGSGKSQTAKAVHNQLFDDDAGFVKFDMSEYSEAHSVSRLIGAPPGYLGSDRGGQLTDAVRRNPYSVVLFDELEKAHNSVFNLFLQILDEGRLTDNQGVQVDFSNTVIILTSNVGAHHIYENAEENLNGLTPRTIKNVMDSVFQTFRMEFVNRLDEVVCFEPLRKPQLVKIVQLQLKSLNERLAEENVQISCSDAAVEAILADSMKNPAFGARPIGKYMERVFVTDVSKLLATQTISNSKHHLLYDCFNNELVYTSI